jgi:hypothetical protein
MAQIQINPFTSQFDLVGSTGAGSGVVDSLSGNDSIVVGPSGAGNISIVGNNASGINVTGNAGTNTLTISGIDIAVWSVVTSNTAMTPGSGYITNSSSLLTMTLPVTAAVGTLIELAALGTGGWKIAQNASQLIYYGNIITTTGTGGSLSSSRQGDTVSLVCVVANTSWMALSSMGNLAYV